MNKIHPPFLAQLLFALLTQPRNFAPSLFSGLRTVTGISSSSLASGEPYSNAILALVVDAG